MKNPTTEVRRLPRPVHVGDWHDRPLKWEAAGPGEETQRFATKADANRYARRRARADSQADAIRAYCATA